VRIGISIAMNLKMLIKEISSLKKVFYRVPKSEPLNIRKGINISEY